MTPTVLTAKTSLIFIGFVPSGLVMTIWRAWQASDVSVIVALGVCDGVALTVRDTEEPNEMLRDALGETLALRVADAATLALRETERATDADTLRERVTDALRERVPDGERVAVLLCAKAAGADKNAAASSASAQRQERAAACRDRIPLMQAASPAARAVERSLSATTGLCA